MTKKDKERAAITPAAALDSLPTLVFDPQQVGEGPELGRADLLQSVLILAKMDHLAETKVVQDAVRNALGRVPGVEE